MLDKKPIDKIVFLDIETTTQCPTLSAVPVRLRSLFLKKFEKDLPALIEKEKSRQTIPTLAGTVTLIRTPEDELVAAQEELYNIKGPLHAEFNKVICISIGVINLKTGKLQTKSFCGEDEAAMLQDFCNTPAVKNFYKMPDKDGNLIMTKPDNQFHFCAHNGKIFDFPVLAKRMIYHGIELPYVLDYGEKKPWDITWLIDTKDIWKWGVFDGSVSLDLLAASFGIESSKSLMDGAAVKDAYWLLKELPAIQAYCEYDVFVLASVLLKMKGDKLVLTR